MKTLKIVAIAATALLTAGTGLAQSTPASERVKPEAEKPVAEKVYHAGGRHDQKLHEAAVRARADGHRMAQTTMHAGGRHDVRAHEAAMKADAARSAADRPRHEAR